MAERNYRQTIDIDKLRPRVLAAGADLFREGDAGDGMYLVDSGKITLWVDRNGEHVELSQVGPGNIFGEMALIDGSPRTATATALEDSVVIVVPKATFDLKMALCDPFVSDVLRLLVQNIRRVNSASESARISARDQNPLTRLPGNRSIEAEVESVLADTNIGASLVYFDFDNFKPFNDGFGFAVGDEAILTFAGLMRQLGERPGCFLGHVGGDDFFACFRENPDSAEAVTTWLLDRFTSEVRRFYDAETLARGTYRAKGRDGQVQEFDLLRISAIQLDLPAGRVAHTPALIATLLAQGKKRSKASPTGLYRRSIEAFG